MRNTRIIASIIAFIGTFAVSVGLVWLFFGFPVKPTTYNYSNHNCSQRHGNAIYSLLQRDIRNGDNRDVRSFQSNDGETSRYSIKKHADSVARYVDESGSMDASHLPRDFQIAWQKHMDAWRDYSEFLNEKRNSSEAGVKKENFREIDNYHTNEIDSTWYEVLRIGENYGAFVR
jgi:hypothetical protein